MRTTITMTLLLGVGANACTVFRDHEGTPPVTPPPKEIDMLVLANVDRSAVNLSEHYEVILLGLIAALAEQEVYPRHAALAPMYRRTATEVPLIYGVGDEDGEFATWREALDYFSQDEGAAHLEDVVEGEGQNLAELGRSLSGRAIYHPTTADPAARAYFSEPTDGFLVVNISATARHCEPGENDCRVDGQSAAAYFTATGPAGAAWLDLPGEAGLPKDKIFHASIVTAEGVDYQEFYADCANNPNVPLTLLDVMEPSGKRYFSKLTDGIKDNGGRADMVDLCKAVSFSGAIQLGLLSKSIRDMFD